MRSTTWNIVWGTILVLLAVGCSTKHTVGEGNPSLGVVSITGPSDTTVVPSAGRLSVAEAALLMGAPFVGPTSPVLVMPSNANGVVTVNFTSNSSTGVAAQLGLTVGAYAFNFTTSNISGSLGVGNTVTIIYDGLHYGENGSCTTWVASNVVFTQGALSGYDTLAGSYEATCHNSQNAKDGDRGAFLLKRPGTLMPPPPANLNWCHYDEGHQVENQLSLPQAAIDAGHGGHVKDYAGLCDGRDIPPPPPPTLHVSLSASCTNSPSVAPAKPDCKITGHEITLNPGKSVYLTASATSSLVGDSLTYSWTKTGSGVLVASGSTATFTGAGTVTVTVSDTHGATSVSASSDPITVN